MFPKSAWKSAGLWSSNLVKLLVLLIAAEHDIGKKKARSAMFIIQSNKRKPLISSAEKTFQLPFSPGGAGTGKERSLAPGRPG